MDAISVSELTALVKHTLEAEYLLSHCVVEGTISNLKKHSSGHYYFSLVDETASIDMALWAGTAKKNGLVGKLENGLAVTVHGSINFYEKTGRLSVICNHMIIGNKSDAQIAFEKLKAELLALGYFDEGHKQRIPTMASCIGIVTSSSGAVLHDILHVSARRNRHVKFKLFSVPVQGTGCGDTIAKGVEAADHDPEVELIIVGRGGGSMEDLWCFNERPLIEAIYKASTPIISAVGHEVDYTLCDFVADVRAATPSQAAEIAVKAESELQDELMYKLNYLHQYMQQVLRKEKQQLDLLSQRKLALPAMQMVNDESRKIHSLQEKLNRLTTSAIHKREQDLLGLTKHLDLLNPATLLVKGYSKIEYKGKPFTSVETVAVGDQIDVHVEDGYITTTVEEVHRG